MERSEAARRQKEPKTRGENKQRVRGSKFTAQECRRVPASVLVKLIFFSLLMLVVPLGIFYASFKFFFHGKMSKPTPSAHAVLGNIVYSTIFAIVAVNVILFGYVLVAILENDDGDEAGIRKKET